MDTTRVFTKDLPGGRRLSGLVTVPPDFEKTTDLLPVIVFLHGIGERGDGTPAALETLKRHGPPKLFTKNPAYRGLRVVTVSPQCPADTTWDRLVPELLSYIDSAVSAFRGDPGNVSLTGLSMGGFGTWALLFAAPEKFRRAAPICGGLRQAQTAPKALKGKPIRVFHAVDDPVVPMEADLLPTRAAIAAGADVSFTAYCGLGHDCWTKTYEETDLLAWLAGKR